MNGLYNNGYAYKDYGLTSSSLGLQNQDHQSTYMNPEQTFHTPSFGDEEFDIPPLSLHSGMAHDGASMNMSYHHQQEQQQQHLQHQQQGLSHPHGMGEMLPPQQSTSDFVSSTNQMMGGPQYQQQPMYIQQMTQDNVIRHPNYDGGSQPTYINMSPHPSLMIRGQQPQHSAPGGIAVSSSMQTGSQQAGGLLTTISQSQLTSHLGVHFNMGHPPTSSPRSNQTSPGQETSEDSDDNVHHLGHMLGGLGTKRPSPEPAGGKMGAAVKKPKVPKKKKKRDPNEPQKPVSAYALFFRDTQAAIKGQNPNASFGEVSKIVASMWDSLDEDHKNVYKKRTEAAKKEYLKALAAYRASLVSKSAADHVDSVYGTSSLAASSTSPPSSSSPPNTVTSSYMISQFGSSPTVSSSTGILGPSGGVMGMAGSSPPQELSPLQKKSPLLTSLMEGGSPQGHSGALSPQGHPHSISPPHPSMTQQQVMHSNQMQSAQQQQMGMMQSLPHQISSQQQQQQQHQQQQHQQQQQQHQQQQQQQQQAPSSSPLQTPSFQTLGIMNNPQASPSPGQGVVGGQNPQMVNYERQATCLRNGCSNPAMDSPEWDSEYCSNDCVGRFHCMGGLTPNLQLLCFRQVNPMVGTESLQSFPTSW